MTRAAPQRVSVPAEVLVPMRGPVVLSWSISRSAARSCGLVTDESGPAVRLEVEVSPPGTAGANISARVLDAQRFIPLDPSPRFGSWIQDSIRGVWHMDVEGLLKLTIRAEEGRVEALYARTELLARAGIAGGRYEFEGARIRPAD